MTVRLIWATPKIDQMIIDIARVSSNKPAGSSGEALIEYLCANRHWSPFEMASLCIEVTGITRDITRQMLRHGFRFQEFSQRYADVSALGGAIYRECRLKDAKNRQSSIPCEDEETNAWWLETQKLVEALTTERYAEALERGIAKEVARAILPEGMTPTKMYVSGNVRQWLFYLHVRWDEGVQTEHFDLADDIAFMLKELIPNTFNAFMRSMVDA